MTWNVIIDPGHGRMGVGQYDPGLSCGCLIEADLSLQLATAIAEELQRACIRHRVLWEVKEGSGILLAHRAEQVPDRGTLISLHFDQLPKPGQNGGRIFAGKSPESVALANRIAPCVDAWGATTCGRYTGCAVVEDHAYGWINRPAITSLIVSPFSVSAPDALIYSRRLEPLGHLIAAAVASWALGRNPAIRCYQPLVAQRDVGVGQAAKPMGELFRGRAEEPRKNDTSRRVSVLSPIEPSE